MQILSPFDLVNMFNDMKPGQRKIYYVGSIRYDRGEKRGAPQYTGLWKLQKITEALETEGLALLFSERLGEFKYNYFLQKRLHVLDPAPESILDFAEMLEHKTMVSYVTYR